MTFEQMISQGFPCLHYRAVTVSVLTAVMVYLWRGTHFGGTDFMQVQNLVRVYRIYLRLACKTTSQPWPQSQVFSISWHWQA